MKAKELREVLRRFPGKHVLVVGDVMLDEYVWGEVRRISPEAPVPVVEMRRRTYVPGGAANTAAGVARLGGRVHLGGVVGRDSEANRLADCLRVADVDAGGLIAHPARQTTTKTRVIAHSQQVVRIDREDDTPLDPEAEDRLLRWAEEMLVTADVCVLSDYAKGAVSPRFAQTMIELAGRAGKPVVIDPKGTDYTKYRGATVIKPNAHEAERVLGEAIHGEAGWLRAGRRLTAMLSGTAVLISRGPEGMSLFQEGPPPLHIPSLARNVFDVTGAGDTVVGTLALALASGASLEQSAHLANRAAGVVVGKVGTATVTLAELQEHLRAARPARRPKVHQRDS